MKSIKFFDQSINQAEESDEEQPLVKKPSSNIDMWKELLKVDAKRKEILEKDECRCRIS